MYTIIRDNDRKILDIIETIGQYAHELALKQFPKKHIIVSEYRYNGDNIELMADGLSAKLHNYLDPLSDEETLLLDDKISIMKNKLISECVKSSLWHTYPDNNTNEIINDGELVRAIVADCGYNVWTFQFHQRYTLSNIWFPQNNKNESYRILAYKKTGNVNVIKETVYGTN